MSSGIYQILNTRNNKHYIGSSINVSQRIYEHRYRLRHSKHSNSYLQNAFNKDFENFEFKQILECVPEDLIFYEDLIIKSYKTNQRHFGYNLRVAAKNNYGSRLKSSHKSGDTYNKITLIEARGLDDKRRRLWLCRCECGREFETIPSNVRHGYRTSCGCKSKYSRKIYKNATNLGA